MKRRNFFKFASLSLLFGGALSFGANKLIPSNKKEEIIPKYKFDPFSGCKSSGFKFSAPLPFSYDLIDQIVELNKNYKKCQLTTLYNAMPNNIPNPTNGFMFTGRGSNKTVKSFDDFANYVQYAQNKGFKFVFLLNSPKPFFDYEFYGFEKKFKVFLKDLKSIGCNNIKVANTQVLEILKDYPDFNIIASTSCEYTSIRQIDSLLKLYPRISSINMATDTNRNIPLLKNTRELFPDKPLELLIEQNCVNGCPARISHPSGYCFISCINSKYGKWEHLTFSNVIYPWNLDLYSQLGIRDFKFIGVIYGERAYISSIKYARDYFEAVEHGLKNFSLRRLLITLGFPYYFSDDTIHKNHEKYLKTFIDELPDINHFIQNGHKCAIRCGNTCNYCMKCAKRLDELNF